MKKFIRVFAIIIVSLFFIPNVFAKNDVHYFLTYPDGSEEVLETYDTSNPKEKMIYTGRTNANGEILLCDWAREGELRIVQRVPSGYSTNKEELRVTLGNDTKAQFVDFKIDNPYTSSALWIVLLVGVVTLIGVYTVKRGNKKVLLMIPIALFGFVAYRVYADNCFQIRIVDKQGNPLSNVEVLVYSKPIHVEKHPAIKIDANGGKFIDGTEEIYIKIPFDGCYSNDIFESYTDEERENVFEKIRTVYRDGYYLVPEEAQGPFYNGDVIYLEWDRDRTLRTFDVDGNGGSTTIAGKVYTRYTTNQSVFHYINRGYPFINGDLTQVGWDDNPECSHYDSNGVATNLPLSIYELIYGSKGKYPSSYNVPEVIYACWNGRPDGIYVDSHIFIGNDSSCFYQSDADIYDNHVNLYNFDSDFNYYDSGDNLYVSLYVYQSGEPVTFDSIKSSRLPELKQYDGATFQTITVVKNGQIILTITEDDFAEDENGLYIANTTKANQFRQYFNGVYDCSRPDYFG